MPSMKELFSQMQAKEKNWLPRAILEKAHGLEVRLAHSYQYPQTKIALVLWGREVRN